MNACLTKGEMDVQRGGVLCSLCVLRLRICVSLSYEALCWDDKLLQLEMGLGLCSSAVVCHSSCCAVTLLLAHYLLKPHVKDVCLSGLFCGCCCGVKDKLMVSLQELGS